MARWSLIEPSLRVTGLQERATARLLAGVLLVVVGFGALTTLWQLVLVPGFFPGTFIRVSIALVVLGMAWVVSRTRHFRISAWVAVLVPLIATAAQGVSRPEDILWWAFMMLSPLFATMFLPMRVAVTVAGITALTAAAILLSHRGHLPPKAWVGPIVYHVIFAPLVVAAAWHRARLERSRHEELLARDVALSEARRMESVGRLAAGIAHDFNNLLTVVAANAELIALRARGDADTISSAQEIVEASSRAAALTRQLLAFGKGQPHASSPVSLARVVDDLEPMIRRLVGDAVTLEVSRPTGTSTVMADSSVIERVVMNLVANAREAMPQGGALRLATRVEADRVVLSVGDTGVGMSVATQERVFEPYFSTRHGAGGTGLGLATTRSIVEQCGGTISVTSELGRGTEFRVALPLSAEPVPARGSRPTPTRAAPLTARVLLVDDNEGIRQALERALTSHGATVATAGSAEEALVLAASTPFDVLVTDVVMPGMHGPALAQTLRQIRPSLPVVFMSAHHEVAGLDATPGAVLLDKPLRIDVLVETLAGLGPPVSTP